MQLGARRAKLRLAAESEPRFVTSPIRFGAALTAAQVATGAHVCLLLDTAYIKLRSEANPVGQVIRAGDRRYTIVGVFAKPTTGIAPSVVGSDVLIPAPLYERDYARGRPFSALASSSTTIGCSPQPKRRR